jgi:hypothetical protein
VRACVTVRSMSAKGQKQTFPACSAMPASPPKADIAAKPPCRRSRANIPYKAIELFIKPGWIIGSAYICAAGERHANKD